MTIPVKDWKNRPAALDPLPDETLAQWETRAAVYIAANPSLVTLINAAAMEDLETRFGTYVDSQIATIPAGPTGATGSAGATGPTGPTGPAGAPGAPGSTDRGPWLPADNSLLAANFDPRRATEQIDTLNGEILWAKIWVPTSVTIANLVIWISSPGAGFSTGNYGGLWSSTGTLIAKTAEKSTPWATAGALSMALTAESGQSLTKGGVGVYLIAGVMSRATTRPIFGCELVGEAVNLNLTGLGLRSGQDSSDGARTTLPATITAGNQGPTFRQVWVGLS